MTAPEVNLPGVVAEVEAAVDRYERALVGNDVAALTARVDALAAAVAKLGGKTVTAKKAAAKAQARKAPARKAAKPSARKAAA